MSSKTPYTLKTALFAISVFLEITIALVAVDYVQNKGIVAYTTDDAYIHMSMAKNFALHNVWGVTPYEFSSSTSSPLWTLILGILYKLFGVNDYIPLALNVVCAIAILILLSWIFHRHGMPRWLNRYLLLAVVFLMPLPTLVLSGLEHVLQTLVIILFTYVAGQYIANLANAAHPHFNRQLILLMVLSALITSVRYESIFAVFIVCSLLLLQQRWSPAVLVAAAGAIPIIVYGMISIANGSMLIPNSVLLKGYRPDFSNISGIVTQFGLVAIQQLSTAPHILMFVLLALLLLYQRVRQQQFWSDSAAVMAVIFVGTTLLHMQFARTGWFYRYEAYLIVLGICVLGVLVASRVPEKLTLPMVLKRDPLFIAAIVFFFLLPAITRGVAALHDTPGAEHEIYSQYYPLADFLNAYYQGVGVATHDIGIINYRASTRDFDVWGLGDVEVARLRLQSAFDVNAMADLAKARGSTIAIYSWDVPVPDSWTKIASWKIDTWIVVGNPELKFYAIDPAQKTTLLSNLKAFAPQLPPNVAVAYYGSAQ